MLPSAALMGKRLIICEKASVQRDVVGALPGSFKKNGDLFESDEFVVGAASATGPSSSSACCIAR